MKDLTVEIKTKFIDGWVSDGIEYALVQITVSNQTPELILFNSIEED